jgi:siroheme synthase-like protein
MDVYPLFLINLSQQRCVVIGGAQEAEWKVQGLLDAAAAVTVISSRLTAQLHAWAQAGRIAWVTREYAPGDLHEAFLVLATGRDPQVNTQIWQEAQTAKALINVVDDPARSTFIAGSVVRQGTLTLAISTGGAAPALAVRLRQRFEQEFGPEYAVFLDLMQEVRGSLVSRYPDFQERRARWYALIDSDILSLLRAGQIEQARQRVGAILDGPARETSDA